MPSVKTLFIFGWPSHLGGADTKLRDLLTLLHKAFEITVVPNFSFQLQQIEWIQFMDSIGVNYSSLTDLPLDCHGATGLALGNDRFFDLGICETVKKQDMKVAWSQEMMWHFPGELEAIERGLVDRLLLVSELQQSKLAYRSDVSRRITGNFVDPERFPFQDSAGSDKLRIGRLSRADPGKYPEDFPVFYEAMGIPNAHYRVMAWSSRLAEKYKWHEFGEKWELLPACAEDPSRFLRSLDVFLYPLGHKFTESWGRSTFEAMLSGAVPIVSAEHHLEKMVKNGENGFVCKTFEEFRTAVRKMRSNDLRRDFAKNGRDWAILNSRKALHLEIWSEALTF